MANEPLKKLFASINHETQIIHRDVRTSGLLGAILGPIVNINQERLDQQRSRIKNLEIHSEFKSFKDTNSHEFNLLKSRVDNSQVWIDRTRDVNTYLSDAKLNLGISALFHGTVSLPMVVPAQNRRALPPSDD